MARDILNAVDALERASGFNRGLGPLVTLLNSSEGADMSSSAEIGELIWAVQKAIDDSLREALSNLKP